MADQEGKKSDFVVNDRRLFNDEGELRHDVVEAQERAAERERETTAAQQRTNEERSAQQTAAKPQIVAPPAEDLAEEVEGPSAEDQQASADAYAASTRKIDERIKSELGKQGQGHRAQDYEMNFEKFVASLYMTTLMQLGLAAPQGAQPQIDLIGARQTVDILGLLHDKTKGNLTAVEEGTLRNVLYELRMAYLEVTNLIANPPKATSGPGEA